MATRKPKPPTKQQFERVVGYLKSKFFPPRKRVAKGAVIKDPPEPVVDCGELLQFITAAQALYTEHCPIASTEN